MTEDDPGERVDCLVRAADAGDTFISWRWVDALGDPRAQRLIGAPVDSAIEHLDRSLITPLSGESDREAATRALGHGAFATLDGESALASALGEAILPARLAEEIHDRVERGQRLRLRLTPSPRLARIPWEILRIGDGDKRLLETVDIVYDPPATVRAERSVPARTWVQHAQHPGLFIIDPAGPPDGGSVLVGGTAGAESLAEQLQGHISGGGALASEETSWEGSHEFMRDQLSTMLRTVPRSRLFYYGHVVAEPNEPGSAALLLSDKTADSWGMARPDGNYLPLCALDLLLGTTMAPPEVHDGRYGFDGPVPGHEIWPMPPRVAIIACEGGADYRARETFGLVMAMINAGAELVTTTRWTLPTDAAFWHVDNELELAEAHPTTSLAMVVDDAHARDDPIALLAEWQRAQLDLWRDTRGALSHSPLVWASLVNTWAPDATVAESCGADRG